MFYFSPRPRDLFAEFGRIQSEMQQALETSSSIRGFARNGFPALNVGGTPFSVEVYAFVPGLAPESIEVQLERGVLTLMGERKGITQNPEQGITVHMAERFNGGFRRVVTLPEDIDPNSVEAKYRDGVLHVSMRRREEAQPRRISIQ